MSKSGGNKKGCLRPLLIGVITITSVSFAVFYSIFLRGRYDGKDLDYKALVFKNVDVWSGPGEVEKGVTVVMEGQLITCVGNDCAVPPGAKVFEGDGKSLIPGLIDMQLGFYTLSSENQERSPVSTLIDYTRQRPEVRRHLHEAGVTTIRSAGDPMGNIHTIKRQIADWKMAGPRIFAVGPVFTAVAGHPAATIYKDNERLKEVYTTQVSDSNRARREVLSVLDAGMDGIKLVLDDFEGKVSKMDSSLASAIVRQAQRRNVWVAIRTGSNADIQLALRLGANVIEYASRERLDSTTLRMLKERDALVVPVLISSKIISEEVNPDWYLYPAADENVALMAQSGIALATGSATGRDVSFGSSLHSELEFMVEAGLDPHKVLEAACINPLYLFKMDGEFGKIQKGYTAEAVLINGRPWEDIKDIRKVEAVVQDGRLVVENGVVVD